MAIPVGLSSPVSFRICGFGCACPAGNDSIALIEATDTKTVGVPATSTAALRADCATYCVDGSEVDAPPAHPETATIQRSAERRADPIMLFSFASRIRESR